MALDQILTERVRNILKTENVIEENRFECLCFLADGNLACGIHDDHLMVHVGEDRMDEILTHPLAKPLVVSGKSIPGCIEIIPNGIKRDVDLSGWVRTGLEYARSLSEK